MVAIIYSFGTGNEVTNNAMTNLLPSRDKTLR